MKNKLLIVLAVLLFTVFALGSGSSDSKTNDTEIKGNDTQEKTNEGPKENVTIEETVIFEEEGIKVTAKEFVEDSLLGQSIKVLIENNGNQDVTISADALAVNGFMVNDLLYETVTAGQKVNSTIDCYSTELKQAGITNIGEVDVWFRLTNPSTYKEIFSAKEPAVIKTSLYDKIDNTIDMEGIEVVNQDGIKIIAKYVEEDSFWGKSVLFYIENNSDKFVGISADNVSVNGFMMTDLFSADVKPGYKAFDDMSFLSSQLKENGIEKIENIKMKIKCYNRDSYRTIFETDYIELTIN